MRRALRLCAALLLLATISVAAAYLYLRQSLPQSSGRIELAGLGSEVEVLRDRHGVPHIYAASLEDAHFALGFVHAQDRLWQMEMNRRIGSGRLAEILGPNALEVDRLRTLGLPRVAQANLERYDADTRRLLDAYAAGVNAFLAGKPVLPPEFWLLNAVPEPWNALDSVVWTKVMAWDISGNWRSELLRMRLSRTLPLERIQELLPPYPGDSPPRIADLKALYSGIEKTPAPPSFQKMVFPGFKQLGRVGRAQLEGKLLTNDHASSLTAPPVWYLAHLHAPGMDAIGGTLPACRDPHRPQRAHRLGPSPTPAPTPRTCTSSGWRSASPRPRRSSMSRAPRTSGSRCAARATAR
jgi:penicillin amidase